MSTIASSAHPDPENSKIRRWIGRALSGLMVLFLLMDSAMKLMSAAPALKATEELGYPSSIVFGLGVLLLACVVAYLVPRTSAIGAILLTGYLGGAIASQLRAGHPLWSHVLFPLYVALPLWGGLCLRDLALMRALLGRR
ncbi:MAG TPA: DoxX family protein [Polyangiales bacterium]|jgi:xanthine/uracil permease